jgi:hypothetical protein
MIKEKYLKMFKDEYVRFFELHFKAVICEKAKKCTRGCPCAEMQGKFILIPLSASLTKKLILKGAYKHD